jgi:hypothetical protein
MVVGMATGRRTRKMTATTAVAEVAATESQFRKP